MLQGALKAPVLAYLAKQYGNPKRLFADVTKNVTTIFHFDGTTTEDKTGYTDRIKDVAKKLGFKTISEIGIEFEAQIIVINGTDRNDKPKQFKL